MAAEQCVSVVLELCSRCTSFLLLQPWRRVSNGNRKQMIGFKVWMSGRHSTWASWFCVCFWLLSKTWLKHCEESVKQYWYRAMAGRKACSHLSLSLECFLCLTCSFWWFYCGLEPTFCLGKKKVNVVFKFSPRSFYFTHLFAQHCWTVHVDMSGDQYWNVQCGAVRIT